MAPSRGKGKASVYPLQKSSPAQGSRRTPHRAVRGNDGVPSVYKDMLAEASANDSEDTGSDRPLKRRKVAGSKSGAKDNLQTVEDSSASGDDSENSEFDFEDVDIEQHDASSPAAADSKDDEIEDISVAVDTTKMPKRAQGSKRKAATPAEKAHRLLTHKLHIICLLGHCMYVNSWCNDEKVHVQLRKSMPKKTRSYLEHNPDFSQFQQNRSFLDGLQQASEMWRAGFQITTSGLHRPKWQAPGKETQPDGMNPVDRGEFRGAVKDLNGSQDMGNELFCALLRAVGVEARLVCSLPVLPFVLSSKANVTTPSKDGKKVVYASASGLDSPATDSNNEDVAMKNSATVGKVPSARRRLGQPAFANRAATASTAPKKTKPIQKLTYPVFWVEAFNKAHQTWVPVDPLVTQTVGKASKLEPPSSYEWNQMSYVIAFESDGVARDVTKRYAKAFNAKTRRSRVESAESDGVTWFRKALKRFKRPRSDESGRDRDQIEDAQLAQREAQEGLPNNVQDFKHHPYYALERHLRRHEVIHPRREVGKVNAGTAAKPRMEAVFRQNDVQACKSAEKWFRVGREVREGEQPLKRVPARRTRNVRTTNGEDDGEEVMISPLYAPFQTQLYTPPSVVKGKVPRNAYGNLDVYVPSMVPPGGAHIRHPLAKEAARILKVDAVDAVTGFKFQGRQGTAIVEGVVVAAENKAAIEAAIEGLQDDQTEQDGMARSVLALKMWKRFLTALRIKERVSQYGDGSTDVADDVDMENPEDEQSHDAGGFLTEDAIDHEESNALPTAGKFSFAELLDATPTKTRPRKARKANSDESEEAESSDADHEDGEDGGFEPEVSARTTRASKRAVVVDESKGEDRTQMDEEDDKAEDSGGGFVPEDDMGGGFVVDDEMAGGFEVEGELEQNLNDATQANGNCAGLSNEEGDAATTPQELKPQSNEPTEVEFAKPIDKNTPADVPMHDTFPAPESSSLVPSRVCETSEAANTSETVALGVDASGQAKEDAAPQLSWQVHGVGEAERHEWPEKTNDDDSDKGSMLSHDPEDEDAEPDWLESD